MHDIAIEANQHGAVVSTVQTVPELTVLEQERVCVRTGVGLGVELLVRPNVYPGGAEAYYAWLRSSPSAVRLMMENRSAMAAIDSVKSVQCNSVSINFSWPFVFSAYGEKALVSLRSLLAEKSITIEVLECDPVDYNEAAIMVAILRRQGFRVAIDDLGKGYARTDLLNKIREIDEVKFDGTLIHTASSHELAEMVSLVHQVGAIATAEWIETLPHLLKVRDAGFDVAQGYYLGKPRVLV